MRIQKYIPILLATGILCSSLLIGCKQSTPDSSEISTTTESVPETTIETEPESTYEETSYEELSTETATEDGTENPDLKSITITVINSSDINVGMFSVIDPVTYEQINVGSLESGTMISLESNWPADTAQFQWALYNEAGELCIDASTDISNVNSAVALNLTGEGTIDDVEVISE